MKECEKKRMVKNEKVWRWSEWIKEGRGESKEGTKISEARIEIEERRMTRRKLTEIVK